MRIPSLLATGLLFGTSLVAQAPGSFTALTWRSIGPNRGGRSIAASGSTQRPFEYWFGATGGGLWKTTDGGTTWAPVTDGQIRSSSVGAVAVAPSNPDVIWLGMGETQLRGNVMQGDGVYRSTDAGKTWQHAGLAHSQAIGRIRVDPANADRAYVAVLGSPFVPSEERGVYRTTDGGRTWSRILHRSDRAGAADLIIDPDDPQTLYATFWEVYRRPWVLWSGGEGSGLYKSTDGGDTWTELTRNPGLPVGTLGKVTVAVSGADSRRVYANVEATDGGLHRSDDGGRTWQRVNGHRDLWQRAFYFLRVVADPRDRETVYVLSFQLEKSTDGGKTFTPLPTTHADHHDLWIDPANPQRMIQANDGGASVSVNGGRTWTDQGFPTAQIYRVVTTSDRPYHVCGAQQDNTTVCVSSGQNPSSTLGARPGEWFYAVAGGESADIAVKPGSPGVFYAGSTNTLTRFDRQTGAIRDIQPHPRIVMGEPASAMPERWNWTYPIATNPKEPAALFAGSQHLWKSIDEGRSWRRISPDLTRADPATLGNTGGPIVFDQDGPEVYATIFTIAPSRVDPQVIWTGSDDGLVQVTRDGGRTWRNVTPSGLVANSRVSRIDASPHRAGTAWVAVERHQMGDRQPYIWKTTDFGATWKLAVGGIPAGAFVRVVREDHVRPGLLVAGTEHGVYASLDHGEHWMAVNANLPDVQVSDLVIEGRDVVAATHGRGFWIGSDLTRLRHATIDMIAGNDPRPQLFAVPPATRNLRPASIELYLPPGLDSARLEVRDTAGRALPVSLQGHQAGFHRVTWNLMYPGATSFPGIVLEGGDPVRGVRAPSGRYTARLTTHAASGSATQQQVLVVERDPRAPLVTESDVRAQFALVMQIRDAETEANEAVLRIRALRSSQPALFSRDTLLARELAAVEGELYQVRNQSPKDKIAFPIKLNDRLTGLRAIVDEGDGRPTASQDAIYRQLRSELDALLARLNRALGRVS